MFGSRTGTPTIQVSTSASAPLSIAAATEIAIEYSSLSAPQACPKGIYVTPSQESLLKWYGLFFVHEGPYANAVLRFILTFPTTYPEEAPKIQFESEVFHPLIDPKTKIWYPRGGLANWKPRRHHIPHLLHSLKRSFTAAVLDEVTEEQAVNKQIWSLYHHSHHTFLSMTAQRALSTASTRTLYPSTSDVPTPRTSTVAGPETPRKAQAHMRKESNQSLRSKASRESLRAESESYIAFSKLEEEQRVETRARLFATSSAHAIVQ